MRVLQLSMLLAACAGQDLSIRRDRRLESPVAVGADVPVLNDAAVVAFWLAAADTMSDGSRRVIQREFRRSNDVIAQYLSDTDVAMVTTLSDTVVVEADGERYLVLLSGFDFPFGYLLIEPGYDEEFHTGLMVDADLEAAIDEYFEFTTEGSEARGAMRKNRIALRLSRLPSDASRAPARFVLASPRSPRRP